MSEITFALLWCSAQVTIVTAAALVVAWIVMERRPEFAAKTAGWAAVVVLASRLLVPFRMPSLQLPSASEFRVVDADISPNDQQRNIATDSRSKPVPTTGANGIQFDLASLVRKTSEFRISLPPTGVRVGQYVAIGLFIAAAVGLSQFVLGLVMLSCLHRRSKAIRDGELNALADEVKTQLGYLRPVTVAESSEIGCGAVVGIIRPTVLLSNEWKSWTPGELRAVLAHEMAHICRRDSVWRFVATMCSAIHVYNPLFRWLVGRLVLAQELAADRLAIVIAGGRGIYLRSLSQLAIRQDTRSCVRSQPLSTPVFTGHLLRRLEMLRAMDCEQKRSPRRWLSSGVIASIVLFGIATSVMRGFAQTSDDNKSTDTPVIRASATKVIDQTGDPEWTSTLFQRKGFPTTHPSFGQEGALHVNFGAMMKVKPLLPILEVIVNDDMLPKELAKKFDLSILESITSDVRPHVTTVKNVKRLSFAFGGRGTVFRCTRDVDWNAAIADRFPNRTEKTLRGLAFLQVNFSSLAALPIRLRPVSKRELSLSTTGPPGGADEWQISFQEQPKPTWSEEWSAVSGGVLALVMANPEAETLPSFKHRIGADQYRVIYKGVDLNSIGVDVSDDARFVEMKVRLRCKETADPDQVLAAVRQLLTLIKGSVDNRPFSSPDDEVEMMNEISSDALETAKTRLIEGKPAVVECHLRFAIPSKLLLAWANKIKNGGNASSAKPTAEKPKASTERR
jgi:beta-lactamase regulating signal transducer with metallopeptidase domain